MVKARSALVIVMLVLVTPAESLAHHSPAGCAANRVVTTLVPSASTAATGDVIAYRVTVANIGALACDVSDVSARLTLPAADGTPTGQTLTLATGAAFPAGTPETLLAVVPYRVAVAPGVTAAVAELSLEGLLHNLVNRDDPVGEFRRVGLQVTSTASSVTATGGVGGTVPATLALTLGAAGSFGAFVPGRGAEYSASTAATVTSTAGDAALTVTDPSPNAPGHLVNGAFSLPQPLQGLGTIKTWSAPVANEPVTVTFKQAIGATDALRTGTYSKTVTFTLSTAAP